MDSSLLVRTYRYLTTNQPGCPCRSALRQTKECIEFLWIHRASLTQHPGRCDQQTRSSSVPMHAQKASSRGAIALLDVYKLWDLDPASIR